MRRHYGAMPPGLPSGDPEDCGPFCVWWYTQILRDRSEVRRWAYALRDGAVWRTGSPVSGFDTRDAVVKAGEAVTRKAI